jgi:hypothetical protein
MKTIPRVRAQTFMKKLRTGRTKPAIFGCRNENGKFEEFVVKFHSRLGYYILCEIIAGIIGRVLGLPIPKIAVVEIETSMAPMIPCPETREVVSQNSGPHFGSLFASPGFTTLPVDFSIPEKLTRQALDIFFFDMLIQNADRSFKADRNPNILFDGNEFLIYDHELSFSFASLFGVAAKPWQLRGNAFVKDHVFYDQIVKYGRKSPVSFDHIAKMVPFIPSVLDGVMPEIPEPWMEPELWDKIHSHFSTVKENVPLFLNGIQEALA